MKIQEEEQLYFSFSATLRIFGVIEDLESIAAVLDLRPTHVHRLGERRSARSDPYKHDMWSYEAPVAEERSLSEHLTALYTAIAPHIEYLKELRKSGLTVDIFCGYRSNSDTAGFEVEYSALRIFTELETAFGVSVVIA